MVDKVEPFFPGMFHQAVEYWQGLENLMSSCKLVIDRPSGSTHPRYPDFVYPLDYGYLEGTGAMDGGGLDVWLGSMQIKKLVGVLLSVDLLKKDVEVKLLLGCTRSEMQIIQSVTNSSEMHTFLIERELPGLDFLLSRHSVRHFIPDPVPDALLSQILETVTWAYSAHDRQPLRFVVVRDNDLKDRLVQRILQAPVVVLLCLDESCLDVHPNPERQQAEILLGHHEVSLAGGTLLLAAHMAGLAGVWMCAPLLIIQEAQSVLDIPASWQPLGMVLLGYPTKPKKPQARRSLDEICLIR